MTYLERMKLTQIFFCILELLTWKVVVCVSIVAKYESYRQLFSNNISIWDWGTSKMLFWGGKTKHSVNVFNVFWITPNSMFIVTRAVCTESTFHFSIWILWQLSWYYLGRKILWKKILLIQEKYLWVIVCLIVSVRGKSCVILSESVH